MTNTPQTTDPAPLTIVSFGYEHQADGQAPPAHLTLDLRQHFRDPHIDPALREMTGRDPEVIDTVLSTPGIPALIAAAVLAVRAGYLSGPSAAPLRIAAGCVGGRHRSVVVASTLGTTLSDLAPTVTHLDIDRPVIARDTTTEASGYLTAGGAWTEVVGPDPWGAYRTPCTGCGATDDTGDVPAHQAEDAAHRAARTHAQHCTRPAE
ncbi:hypothetical protein [Streptomyces sp. NPDC059708]|uniref:RapZ C-terminal domain-containing protein n=1 Tax=Streptomyces sp. NPDC059708 TaxID=3346916 RepID=UPI00367C626D